MQVRMLIGRLAGEVVEMPYDRAVANRDLGHVEFVREGERYTTSMRPAGVTAVDELVIPAPRLGARPRGRPRRPIGA